MQILQTALANKRQLSQIRFVELSLPKVRRYTIKHVGMPSPDGFPNGASMADDMCRWGEGLHEVSAGDTNVNIDINNARRPTNERNHDRRIGWP